MKLLYSVFLAILCPVFVSAQCSIENWNLEKRIDQSELVVEGELVSRVSVWDKYQHNIYTLNTIEIYKVFKGETASTSITYVSKGGTVGLESHEANPSLTVAKGEKGIFLLKANQYPVESEVGLYMPSASVQSFIPYDMQQFKAIDWERDYESIKFELYPAIEKFTEQTYRVIRDFDPEKGEREIKPLANPVISGYSVDSLSSGTNTLLTIRGSNFGASRGSAGKVGFKDANYGDGRYYYSPLSQSYSSWSDTAIEIYVPTRAGTGIVEVVNSAGESGESSAELYVKWAHLNLIYTKAPNDTSFYEKDHIDHNGKGGYSWQMTNNFASKSDAVNSFIRSAETWRCGTLINWEIGKDTSLDQLASDSVNIVRFTEFGDNTLGVCWSRSSGCFVGGGEINWHVSELDIEFDSTYNWYYGTGSPAFNEHDFQTVASHELGHGHQLGHVRDNSKIMHYSLSAGSRNVDLHVFDQEGGVYVRNKSVQSNNCGPDEMIAVNQNDCQISIPTGLFTISDSIVCPGEDIVFTNTSVGKVNSYSWNFGSGADTFGVSTEGPHTVSYLTAGTKTVVLIVENDFGKDTFIRTITIVPAMPLKPNPFVFADSTCLGISTYTLNENGDADGYVWALSSGGSFIGGATGNSVQIDWTGKGIHTITVVAANQCGNSLPQIDTVLIVPGAVADFSYSIDGLQVQFTGLFTDAEQFEWSFGDGQVSQDSSPFHQFGDKGNYNIKLKVSNICGTDSMVESISVNFKVGIDPDLSANVKAYPNPNTGNTVLYTGIKGGGVAYLYHTDGKKLTELQMESGQLLLPKLDEGLYVIRVISGNTVYGIRLIIKHE